MSAIIQQSDQWLEKRRTMIGASDAPVIMGVSPWSTKYKLWQEKLQIVEPRKKTEAMQRGLDKEKEAREAFSEETGIDITPDVVFHKENSFMMASLDGISSDRQTIVELKHPGEGDHAIAKSGEIPEKYYPQVQHQIEVCQLEKAYYYSYRNKEDKILIQVYRDDKYIKRMLSEEKQFWECMNEFIAPKLTERDYELKQDDVWDSIATQWLYISNQIQDLEKKEKELREFLISQSQNTNCKGSGVRLCKIVRKGNVDYSQIPELKNMNLEKFRKSPIEMWRISKDE